MAFSQYNRILDYTGKIVRTDIRYLIKGYFWLVLEYGIALLVGIATSIAFANLIDPETYGLYKYALTIMSFLTLATLTRMDYSLSIS